MIECIEPEIFDNIDRISALFTQSNRDRTFDGNSKNGLDFGLKTSSSKEEINNNLMLLSKSTGNDFSKIALARQIHSANILRIDKPGVYNNTDGFVTTKERLVLGIQVADCAAVLIADPINGVIGAFHAGWRGAVSDIIPAGIKLMTETNSEPDNMLIYISPCISIKNFEVGHEVAVQFPEKFCDYKSYKKPHVDLKGFIKHQAIESGVPAKNIESSDVCTMADKQFFSFRREGSKAGRMLGLIVLNI